jgi:hypothetical protein
VYVRVSCGTKLRYKDRKEIIRKCGRFTHLPSFMKCRKHINMNFVTYVFIQALECNEIRNAVKNICLFGRPCVR